MIGSLRLCSNREKKSNKMKRRRKKLSVFFSPLCRVLFLAPWFSSSNRETLKPQKSRNVVASDLPPAHRSSHTAPALLARALGESEGESRITHRIKFEKREEKKNTVFMLQVIHRHSHSPIESRRRARKTHEASRIESERERFSFSFDDAIHVCHADSSSAPAETRWEVK